MTEIIERICPKCGSKRTIVEEKNHKKKTKNILPSVCRWIVLFVILVLTIIYFTGYTFHVFTNTIMNLIETVVPLLMVFVIAHLIAGVAVGDK